MRKTFVSDESIIITIPIGSLRDARGDQLLPEKFKCVFKDHYKVFVVNGKPGPVGAAQALTGVFLLILGLIFLQTTIKISTLPSVLFVITGMLSSTAGKYANMHVTKLSFSLNIISFFWSIGAIYLASVDLYTDEWKIHRGINALAISLLVIENFTAFFLIYWLSKAVCRQHFNSLPTILLKRGE